jgi:hypothetical protein
MTGPTALCSGIGPRIDRLPRAVLPGVWVPLSSVPSVGAPERRPNCTDYRYRRDCEGKERVSCRRVNRQAERFSGEVCDALLVRTSDGLLFISKQTTQHSSRRPGASLRCCPARGRYLWNGSDVFFNEEKSRRSTGHGGRHAGRYRTLRRLAGVIIEPALREGKVVYAAGVDE